MRKLNETELFKENIRNPQEMEKVIYMKLDQNVGDIAPRQIETELLTLKNSSKSSYRPLLNEAFALYSGFNGRIRLFNLGATESGRTPIPSFVPFTIARLKDRAGSDGYTQTGRTSPAVLMNLKGIGHWNEDESAYIGLAALTDLYAELETGVIMYRMLVDGVAEKVFSNPVVLENLTKIYTYMFSNVIVGVASTFGGDDFKNDAARFIIAKFFLKYVLSKTDNSTLDDIAYKAIKNHSSLSGLKMNEENSVIDYSSLTGFLKTFGEAFFGNPIDLLSFETNWLKRYGDATALAVEYAPYLLHFLFATLHGATLGGLNRIYAHLTKIRVELNKLYNAVVSEVK